MCDFGLNRCKKKNPVKKNYFITAFIGAHFTIVQLFKSKSVMMLLCFLTHMQNTTNETRSKSIKFYWPKSNLYVDEGLGNWEHHIGRWRWEKRAGNEVQRWAWSGFNLSLGNGRRNAREGKLGVQDICCSFLLGSWRWGEGGSEDRAHWVGRQSTDIEQGSRRNLEAVRCEKWTKAYWDAGELIMRTWWKPWKEHEKI